MNRNVYLGIAAVSIAVLMGGSCVAEGAMDPRFELDQQALEGVAAPSKKEKKTVKRRSSRSSGAPERRSNTSTVYTVKPGDHLFKILMHEYGLSNRQAEDLIEDICRQNNIQNIRRLKVGQKITIPGAQRQSGEPVTVARQNTENEESVDERIGGFGQALRLEAPSGPDLEQDATARVKDVWDKIVPGDTAPHSPLSYQSSSFSLTLDPNRYPVFASMDGAKIVVDPAASIPPLVRSLITEKDPNVRIVSGSSDNRQFLADMLKSAGFYSVEEDFKVVFGSDPKVIVTADFKVEKTPESLVKQDVVLLNSSRNPLPASLADFLKKEGFTVHEPFAMEKSFLPATTSQIHQVTAKNQTQVVDALLKALAITSHEDRRLDVFAADDNGISLSVKADRYFERGGKRYVITRFDGDPIQYTLFRILETKGYQVVILDAQDSFRKTSEKVLARLKIQGNFAQHTVLSGKDATYSLLMSGFKVEGEDIPGGSLFLTDLELDRVVRDILGENGFQIHENK